MKRQWQGAVVVAMLGCPARVHAQSVPLLVATTHTANDARTIESDVATIASAARTLLAVGPALSEQLRERYGAPEGSGDSLRALRERIPRARRQYSEALAASREEEARAALEALERDADALLAQPEALDRLRENREALISALLFVANVTLSSEPTRSSEALRKLVEVLPDLTLSARVASEAVRAAYREQVRQAATASLVVQSVPDGCQVRRNGVFFGNAPAQLQGLVPGVHRVAVRCGGRTSLVHRVSVGAGATSTVQIDLGLDRALELGATPSLRYDSAGQLEARVVSDASVLGAALGAERVLVFRADARRLLLVDVLGRSIVRAITEREWRDLPRILRTASTQTEESPAAVPPSSPEVRVRARSAPFAQRPVSSVAAAPASRAPWLLLGAVFGGSGLVLGGGATGSWVGANALRAHAIKLGDEGTVLGGLRESAASGERALRTSAIAGWIAGGALALTGASLVVLSTTRSAGTARAFVTGDGIAVEGAF
jgi:hypothetical protein